MQSRARILVQVTIYRRRRINRDGPKRTIYCNVYENTGPEHYFHSCFSHKNFTWKNRTVYLDIFIIFRQNEVHCVVFIPVLFFLVGNVSLFIWNSIPYYILKDGLVSMFKWLPPSGHDCVVKYTNTLVINWKLRPYHKCLRILTLVYIIFGLSMVFYPRPMKEPSESNSLTKSFFLTNTQTRHWKDNQHNNNGGKGSFLLTICFSHCARSATRLYKNIYAENMKHDIKILGYIVH